MWLVFNKLFYKYICFPRNSPRRVWTDVRVVKDDHSDQGSTLPPASTGLRASPGGCSGGSRSFCLSAEGRQDERCRGAAPCHESPVCVLAKHDHGEQGTRHRQLTGYASRAEQAAIHLFHLPGYAGRLCGAGSRGAGRTSSNEQWLLPGAGRIRRHHDGCSQTRRVDHTAHELAHHLAHRLADDDAHAAGHGHVPLPGQGGRPCSSLFSDQLFFVGERLLITNLNIDISVKKTQYKRKPASFIVSTVLLCQVF